MKNVRVALIVIIASVAGIIAVHSYASGMINDYGEKYFSDKFMPGTFINGMDCSQMTAAQAKKAMQDYVDDYTLTINERGGTTEQITGAELGLQYIDDGSVDKLLENQDTEMWQYYLNSHQDHTLPTAYSYDENYLPYLLDELKCMDDSAVQKAQNAYVDENEEGFYIVPEVKGNELDKDRFTSLIRDAVNSSTTEIDLDANGIYLEPEIVSDTPSLVAACESSNRMIHADITFDFVDRQWHADKDLIRGWLVKNADGSCSVDETKVAAWVDEMAYATDTFGLPRTFMTSYGVEIELEGGGDYGWYMDTEETTAQLIQYIYQGSEMTTQPAYIYTANDRSTNDIGNTYVEVCISTQTLWYYYQGELLTTTPIISGCVNLGRATPSGSVWAIDAKKNDWWFTTFPDAFSEYWMPFNGECGIHDASWQPADSYLPDTYLNAGSHGCLNTPYEPVQIIFDHSEIGDPVVVYYSLDQVHGPDPWEELIAG